MKCLLIILFLSLNLVYCKLNYEGFKVYRLFPSNIEQMIYLKSLENDENYDFWTPVNNYDLPVEIMVSPKLQVDFLKAMFLYGIKTNIFIEDLSRLIKNNHKDVTKSKNNSIEVNGMSWNNYYELDDIYAWLEWQARKHQDKIQIINLEDSYEGRYIKGVHISFGKDKRAVFIEGGIHAREWISPATVNYIINELLYTKDIRFRNIAESFDWYLFPVVNPDGYVYTHNYDRLWRKSRSNYGLCSGVDLNRNWDFHWGESGTSNNPCSYTFGGYGPFSEPETKALSNFISTVGSKLDVYLSFHSYSQLILIPFGNASDHYLNYDDVYQIGKKAADAIQAMYGTEYGVGNTVEMLYPATGCSDDWAKEKFNIPVAWTYELRDRGENGFILPSEQIQPNCEEVMESLIATFTEAENLGYFKIK